MHIAADLDASFVVHAGSCVWRLLSSSVAMRRREVEGVRSPTLFSCGCDALRVAALSWAPNPIEGGMAVGFCAASWMDEGSLAPCECVVGARSVCVTAAGIPGDVSGDADAVVVPVDVSCAPSDGSLSYRVCVCVWKCSAAGAEAQHENYTFSGFDVRMHSRNGELGAVCHVANAAHTCSSCAASCATEEEGATVAFTMNVTTHKYAGPYEF
ncbi:mucin-like glycoprotein [Trypanosoma cruzi]|nr:mucin-like glycoprotein [Trypanosoma cruzi]